MSFQAENGTISGFHQLWVPGFDKRRDDNVEKLGEIFSAANLPLEVYRDKLRNGVLFTLRRILFTLKDQLLDSDAEWGLIIEDDVWPGADNWQEELEAALANSPQPFVSLCHFGDRGLKLARRGFAYGEQVHGTWGQAIAYHRSIIEKFTSLTDWVYSLDPEKYRKWGDGLSTVFNIAHDRETLSVITSRAVFNHLDFPSTMRHVPGRYRGPALTIDNPEFSMENLPWDRNSVKSFPMTLDARCAELGELAKEEWLPHA